MSMVSALRFKLQIKTSRTGWPSALLLSNGDKEAIVGRLAGAMPRGLPWFPTRQHPQKWRHAHTAGPCFVLHLFRLGRALWCLGHCAGANR